MIRYLSARLGRAALTLLGVLTISFLLLRINGNPAAAMLPPSASSADIAALDHQLGFDRPIWVQYLAFMKGALQGDLGVSIRQGRPALGLVLERLPASLELAAVSFLSGAGAAFLMVMAIQLTGNRRLRAVLFWIGLLRQAIPNFVFAVFLIALFAVTLRWLPSMGREDWRGLILPGATVGTFEFTLYMRLLDTAYGEHWTEGYVRTAIAKGAGRARVVFRHILPNAITPLLTIAGMNLGSMLGGLVLVETVFNWPGIGKLVIEAINVRDFPVAEAGLLVMSAIFLLIVIVVDVVQIALDPRINFT